MAKQRRPAQKSTKDPFDAPADPRQVAPIPATPAAAAGPARRTTYVEAVALYERGLEALQRHAYPQATHLLESVLRQYPEERELHERVRLYLNICQKHATPQEASAAKAPPTGTMG